MTRKGVKMARLPGLPLHDSWREALHDDLTKAIQSAVPDVMRTSFGKMGELICHTGDTTFVAHVRDDDSGVLQVFIQGMKPLPVPNKFLRGPLAS
jgi:hypothetical protein